MKFVSATKPICVPHQIPTYTALLQQIHHPPLRTRDVTSRRHPFLSTLIKQLPAIIAVITLLFGLWFGRNVPGAAAKLPLLRHAKAAAAMERAHATCRQSRPSRRAQMNIPDEPMAMSHQIHTYTELRQQIHHDLRIQHPEWVQPNGESPMCDS
jgi:hypothetical protein